MALFKISKGLAANLPATITEGYCYFTTDDGKFYIDVGSGDRRALNAHYADGTPFGVASSLNSSNLNYKVVAVDGVTELFDGLTLAVQNDANLTEDSIYIRINNITEPLNIPDDDGFRPLMKNYDEPLSSEWTEYEVILIVYNRTSHGANTWNVIGGINGNNNTSVNIIRYEEGDI